MRLDSRRPDDKRIAPHCEFLQNGEIVANDGLWMADENLGVVERMRPAPPEGYHPMGGASVWVRDARGQAVIDRSEGPVEIRLAAGAPPEVAALYRERRRVEQRR